MIWHTPAWTRSCPSVLPSFHSCWAPQPRTAYRHYELCFAAMPGGCAFTYPFGRCFPHRSSSRPHPPSLPSSSTPLPSLPTTTTRAPPSTSHAISQNSTRAKACPPAAGYGVPRACFPPPFGLRLLPPSQLADGWLLLLLLLLLLCLVSK